MDELMREQLAAADDLIAEVERQSPPRTLAEAAHLLSDLLVLTGALRRLLGEAYNANTTLQDLLEHTLSRVEEAQAHAQYWQQIAQPTTEPHVFH